MPRHLWLFCPDFRVSNPYQDLLARELSRDADVSPGTLAEALEAVARRPTIFHLHWEHVLYAGAQTETDAAAAIEVFRREAARFQARGGRLIWTMHNAAPHEDRFPALSADLRQRLAEMADIVHVHGETAAELARRSGVPDVRILVVPHPDMAPGYPDDITDEAARRYFHFAADDTVFAFLGPLRGYKGVDLLLEAFEEVHRQRPEAQLLLAGAQPRHQDGRYFRVRLGLRVVPHFIDDGIVQYVLRAADYVVLPYRRILTSGAVSLALGFGRPVIVPDLPPLLEVVQPGREALVFEAGCRDALVRTMLEACEHGVDRRGHMREEARRSAARVTFAQLADAFRMRLAALEGVGDRVPERVAALS
jgi:glycosyltransferase involved in cell wall biosynthesis